jgi:uncharacterized protein YjiS (DUF1127 family)
MLTLALAATLMPSPEPRTRGVRLANAKDSWLDQLVRWTRTQIRYRRALQELRRLDAADLDDLDLARGDFPALAWRHATGAEPLPPPGLVATA